MPLVTCLNRAPFVPSRGTRLEDLKIKVEEFPSIESCRRTPGVERRPIVTACQSLASKVSRESFHTASPPEIWFREYKRTVEKPPTAIARSRSQVLTQPPACVHSVSQNSNQTSEFVSNSIRSKNDAGEGDRDVANAHLVEGPATRRFAFLFSTRIYGTFPVRFGNDTRVETYSHRSRDFSKTLSIVHSSLDTRLNHTQKPTRICKSPLSALGRTRSRPPCPWAGSRESAWVCAE